VDVYPKVNGFIKEIPVDRGSQVKKGQLLVRLEAPEIEQQYYSARAKYLQVYALYLASKDDFDRLVVADKMPGTVSAHDLELARAKMIADSAMAQGEIANYKALEATKDYLTVTASFDGVITERNVHPGALVSAEGKDGKPMLHLGQMDHLRLQVDIPEGIAAGLQNKDTVSFYLSAYPGKKMTGHLTRKSGLVNSTYRAERMEMDVYNKDGRLSPGMYADVLFYSNGNPEAFTVPRTAVVTSTERKYVIAIRDGKTTRIDVATGNESADKVEITGDLRSGEQLVVHATDDLPDGLAIK